jgi:hypothetical protein
MCWCDVNCTAHSMSRAPCSRFLRGKLIVVQLLRNFYCVTSGLVPPRYKSDIHSSVMLHSVYW